MKIRSVGTELFHSERRTDRHHETNSRFSQFCKHAYNGGDYNYEKDYYYYYYY